jgi:hypothetical protein
MKFTPTHQIEFARIALALFNHNKNDIEKLEYILAVGEMIGSHVQEEGDRRLDGVIFDLNEYLYEHIRMLKGDGRAADDPEQLRRLTDQIREHYQGE